MKIPVPTRRIRIRTTRTRRTGAPTITWKSAFKLFGLWQPVFFSGHSWAEKYIGGWSLSGIWNLDTGFPWNPTYGTSGIYYQGSAYGSVRPAGHVAGAGTSTANKTFEGIGGINRTTAAMAPSS